MLLHLKFGYRIIRPTREHNRIVKKPLNNYSTHTTTIFSPYAESECQKPDAEPEPESEQQKWIFFSPANFWEIFHFTLRKVLCILSRTLFVVIMKYSPLVLFEFQEHTFNKEKDIDKTIRTNVKRLVIGKSMWRSGSNLEKNIRRSSWSYLYTLPKQANLVG